VVNISESEYQALVRDARRWQWLRKNILWISAGQGYVRWTFWMKMNEPDVRKMELREGYVAEEFDAAIDAAIEVAK